MPLVQKTVLLRYSARQMFDLVQNVEAYPAFLPWCGGASVTRPPDGPIQASLTIDFRGIRQSFTTRNQELPHERIAMVLLEGPFSRLEGDWHFLSLREDACKVAFSLDYEFSRGLLGQALVPVFGHIAGSMVDAFVRRADAVYG
jgi:ribosome-associated toxin RatA of RatAB toxin-antitoxin module